MADASLALAAALTVALAVLVTVLATSRRRALKELAANLSVATRDLGTERDLLGRVLEAMREGVMVLDEQRRVVMVNPALREMLLLTGATAGRTAREATGNAELAAALDRAASGEAVSVELALGDLKPRLLLLQATRLPGVAGGLLAVFSDVTEIRRLETMRRDFVANVSHELRTPLAAVSAATETLQAGALAQPETAAQFIDMIERNVQRLHRLLEDLLDLSRIEAREYRLDTAPLEFAPLARHAVTLCEHAAGKKSMRLDLDVPANLGLVVADRRALEQVLANLLDNAIKYCPDGTAIAIRATPDGGIVRISVNDGGPGIEAKHLPRLFERFYRVDGGRSRDAGGTGLGLSIVKHLVEAMGGSIGVESSPGGGTTFTFSLPRA